MCRCAREEMKAFSLSISGTGKQRSKKKRPHPVHWHIPCVIGSNGHREKKTID